EHAGQTLKPCGPSGRACWAYRFVWGRVFVELLHERCAGLDIGKKDLKACVRTPSPGGKRSRRQEIRTFATTTNALLELRDWLVAEKVTLVVLEATGDYWRGAFYLLEDCLNVILVNARHVKGLPGRKTDLLTELPGRFGDRDVRGRAGPVRFPRHDQRRGCSAGVVRAGGAAGRVA
ncbi:MAG TPA: transposase, partial [Pseudonocardiaceae bacterium]|nr:transposase [Pseudonocardiaceae bacterium]